MRPREVPRKTEARNALERNHDWGLKLNMKMHCAAQVQIQLLHITGWSSNAPARDPSVGQLI